MTGLKAIMEENGMSPNDVEHLSQVIDVLKAHEAWEERFCNSREISVQRWEELYKLAMEVNRKALTVAVVAIAMKRGID